MQWIRYWNNPGKFCIVQLYFQSMPTLRRFIKSPRDSWTSGNMGRCSPEDKMFLVCFVVFLSPLREQWCWLLLWRCVHPCRRNASPWAEHSHGGGPPADHPWRSDRPQHGGWQHHGQQHPGLREGAGKQPPHCFLFGPDANASPLKWCLRRCFYESIQSGIYRYLCIMTFMQEAELSSDSYIQG